MYVCYALLSKGGKRTYVGVTNDPRRRLRQHRRELTGGARATAGPWDWAYLLHVVGFERDKRRALSFEWHLKRASKRQKGRPAARRVAAARALLARPRWGGLRMILLSALAASGAATHAAAQETHRATGARPARGGGNDEATFGDVGE